MAPAAPAGESGWYFPLTGQDKTQLRFAGRVDFSAHQGLLALTIIDPWLELPHGTGSSGVLTVSTDTRHGAESSRLPLADVNSSGTTTLAEAGVFLFDFRYSAGTQLAPLCVVGLTVFT